MIFVIFLCSCLSNLSYIDKGLTKLMEAVQSRRSVDSFTKTLNLIGSDEIDERDKDYLNRTALMIACEIGNVDAVELLLNKGANVDVEDDNGQTAIDIAIYSSHTELLQILIPFSNITMEFGSDALPLDYSMEDSNYGKRMRYSEDIEDQENE